MFVTCSRTVACGLPPKSPTRRAVPGLFDPDHDGDRRCAISWGGTTQQAIRLLDNLFRPIRILLLRVEAQVQEGTYKPRRSFTRAPQPTDARTPRSPPEVPKKRGWIRPFLPEGTFVPRVDRPLPEGAGHGGADGRGANHLAPADPVALLGARDQTSAGPGEAETAHAPARPRGGSGPGARGINARGPATKTRITPPRPIRADPVVTSGPTPTPSCLIEADPSARPHCCNNGTKSDAGRSHVAARPY